MDRSFFELLSILGRLVILVLLSAGSECTEVFLGQNSRRRKAPLVRPQPNLFSIVIVDIYKTLILMLKHLVCVLLLA
uniref:CASP-like protein n=1 Tax=Salix viminalis TaxID=40686 RepID=A0A6N2MVI9_SALVM